MKVEIFFAHAHFFKRQKRLDLAFFLIGFGTLQRKVLFLFSKNMPENFFTHAHFLKQCKSVILTSFIHRFLQLTKEIGVALFERKF